MKRTLTLLTALLLAPLAALQVASGAPAAATISAPAPARLLDLVLHLAADFSLPLSPPRPIPAIFNLA